MNCSWTIFGFIISSWTVHELMMNCSWTLVFRNFWWIVHELFFFHNKFLNSSWTVMVNCSWTLVHEPTMRVFYELFMNCSWTFMNVHEQFIKSWTTFHRGYAVKRLNWLWTLWFAPLACAHYVMKMSVISHQCEIKIYITSVNCTIY